jgi:hypothetical protein
MRTLETLRKMWKEEFGTGNEEAEKADDREQMADDREQMADDGCEVRAGGCGDGESGETMPEVSQGPIVGYDSNRVIDDSTNDTIGILSYQGRDATDRPYQGACGRRQSLPSGVKMRENVQNEANPESTQSSLPLVVESYSTEPAGRKRSQSAAGAAVPHAEESDEWPVNCSMPGHVRTANPCPAHCVWL